MFYLVDYYMVDIVFLTSSRSTFCLCMSMFSQMNLQFQVSILVLQLYNQILCILKQLTQKVEKQLLVFQPISCKAKNKSRMYLFSIIWLFTSSLSTFCLHTPTVNIVLDNLNHCFMNFRSFYNMD
jgi:hypothetical protein